MGVKLKLLVNRETKKVVFAEAGKEFVDFLMGLMEIPIGSILRLFKQNGDNQNPNSSLEKLYQSISSFDESYLQKSELKNSVLDPKVSSLSNVNQAPVLHQLVPVSRSSSSNSHQGFHSSSSSREVIPNGYVKDAANYMIKDDLSISPSSTISSINLFNINGVKDISYLQEIMVEVDAKKALEVVRAAFHSSTVLTDVFISNDPSIISATTKTETNSN